MDKQEIRRYFDHQAGSWDSMEQRNEENIAEILDRARMEPGLSVLDVACGTGVIIPDYIKRGMGPIVGLDISGEMLKIAHSKFPEPQVCFVEADAESYESESSFDRIMIFNAFPHFPEPEKLIRHLSGLLKPGGILSVAHSMSRARIDECHRDSARGVSRRLMPAEELKKIFARSLEPIYCRDDDIMYQLCGRKK